MPRIAAVSLLAVLVSAQAMAGQSFDCGNAHVSISVVDLAQKDGARALMRIANGSRSTLVRHDNVDFIGGTCDSDAQGQPRIVYQAVCGGSGCHDLANWGVIDPDTLQVLVRPSDDSLGPVQRLLGHAPALDQQRLSVSRSMP